MKRMKNTLIISSYVLLVALFFGGGYALGRMGAKEEPSLVQEEVTVETASQTSEVVPEYELKVEDGLLIIYRCIGDEKTVITSEKISENVFPKEDMEELKNGVRFERLEQAQQMFENFVS